MKHIFGTSFSESIPPEYQMEFQQRLSLQNSRRTFIINMICVAFVLLLFVLDYIRYLQHDLFNRPLNVALMGTHWIVALQAIPMLLISRNFSKIKEGAYDYGRTLSMATLILLMMAMLPMSIISLMNRGSVAIFAIYIGVVNIVVLLPHRERILLNGINTLIFIGAVFWVQYGNPETLVMNLSETLALVVPNFIFATFQYNLSVRQFKNVRLLAEQKQQIEAEKQRSDELLLNILPASVVEELRNTGTAQPRKYEHATVLFSDFIGFSHICRQLSPDELIEDLSYCFGEFDRIIAKYGIERIKTIGDAYMCVAGVPEHAPAHAMDMIMAARDMHQFLEQWKMMRQEQGKPIFLARIGIHSGPVTGGVVGSAKFAFDIWGDTVNIAARMENSSSSGQINISAATYQLVKNDFDFTYRGSIPVKNIGEVEMYYAE